MKFTVNIPVTRKRTKHGYYVLHSVGPVQHRLFCKHKKDAIKAVKLCLSYPTKTMMVMTARDYAKKTKSKPPA